MERRLVRQLTLAFVAVSAVAASLASSGVAARTRHSAARTTESRSRNSQVLRAERHAASSEVASPRQPAVALSPLEGGVLGDINALRAQHHLAPLRLSAPLSAAARAHTQEMAADGYFEHESADGTEFWKRIASFYPSRNWSSWSVGENLLYASPDIDAQGALDVWLNSPPHRANMLNPSWREIGIAAVHASAAPGVFDGDDVTIVTTDFGFRH